MKTVLYFVRHGETQWNAKQIMQGHLDSHLTADGIRQAHRLGEKLREMQLDVLYSSDLGRARNTAAIISEYIDLPIILSPGLREKNGGIFQGITWAEVQRRYPVEHQAYHELGPDYVVPEGESWNQAKNRIVATIRGIIDSQAGKKLLVVTHGGLINIFFRHVLQIPPGAPRRFTIRNSSIHKVIADDGELWLDVMGDTGHLGKTGADEIF